jgi:predicted 2-oxoglutarate/Fe(II)-dependent dioxygenase YbiX
MATEFPEFNDVAEGIFEASLLNKALANRISSSILGAPHWTAATVLLNHGAKNVSSPEFRISDVMLESDAGENAKMLREHVVNRAVAFTEAISERLFRTTSLQFLRYHAGGFYRAHRDAHRAAKYQRQFSILCYLNDDYEGGHTTFPSLGISCRPEAGKVLIFRSNLLHQAEAVSLGCKVAAVTWCIDVEGRRQNTEIVS